MIVSGRIRSCRNGTYIADLDISTSGRRIFGRDGGVTFDERSHDTASSLDTKGQGSDIEEEEILCFLGCVAGKDSSLDCSTVCDGLVGVDALVGLLAIEEVRHEPDNTGDTGGTVQEDNIVDIRLVDLGVAQNLLDGLKSGRALEDKSFLFLCLNSLTK